jgi:hypothetical protein
MAAVVRRTDNDIAMDEEYYSGDWMFLPRGRGRTSCAALCAATAEQPAELARDDMESVRYGADK